MKKKLVAMLLSTAMIVTSCGFAVLAEEESVTPTAEIVEEEVESVDVEDSIEDLIVNDDTAAIEESEIEIATTTIDITDLYLDDEYGYRNWNGTTKVTDNLLLSYYDDDVEESFELDSSDYEVSKVEFLTGYDSDGNSLYAEASDLTRPGTYRLTVNGKNQYTGTNYVWISMVYYSNSTIATSSVPGCIDVNVPNHEFITKVEYKVYEAESSSSLTVKQGAFTRGFFRIDGLNVSTKYDIYLCLFSGDEEIDYCDHTVISGAKAAQTISGGKSSFKVSAKKVGKKKQTVSIGAASNSGVTYSLAKYANKAAKKSKKKIAVKSDGRIVLKKGLKKGTYKIVVNMSAPDNGYYFAAGTQRTITIKVK